MEKFISELSFYEQVEFLRGREMRERHSMQGNHMGKFSLLVTTESPTSGTSCSWNSKGAGIAKGGGSPNLVDDSRKTLFLKYGN